MPENEATLRIRPLRDQVLVKRDPKVDVTPQGVIVPDNPREKPSIGTVIGVGPGVVSELTGQIVPTTVVIGDRVAFGMFAGQDVPGLEGVISLSERELLYVISVEDEA